MPSKTEKLNERIDKRLRLVRDNEDDIQSIRKVIFRRSENLDEARKALEKAKRRVRFIRGKVRDVKIDISELEAETPDEDTEQERKKHERLEHLSGLLEEAIFARNSLLEHIDVLAERQEDARRLLVKEQDENDEHRRALKHMRARRKRIRERQDRPSPNFAYAEFDCNDGTEHPASSEPALDHWCKNYGEALRNEFGTVHIHSGYRTPSYNAYVGGESNSVHVYIYHPDAVAGDFHCERGTPAEWAAFLQALVDGMGRYPTFVHADNRNRIQWPDARWVA